MTNVSADDLIRTFKFVLMSLTDDELKAVSKEYPRLQELNPEKENAVTNLEAIQTMLDCGWSEQDEIAFKEREVIKWN